MPQNSSVFSLALVFAFATVVSAGPAFTDAAKAGSDFAIQGEYKGEVQGKDGAKKTLAVQVIAEGKGKFQAVGYNGGLPGEGDSPKKEVAERVAGELQDGAVTFKGDHAVGVVKDGKMTVSNLEGKEIGVLAKVERSSTTLGAKPPAGATVLFDGTNVDAWEKGQLTDDKLLAPECRTKQKFGNQSLHVEFRTPFMPEDRGQGRGNSGVYLQGRYEVQVLDSFGLEGKDNECGGIYTIKAPDVNACLPPLAWQTYDIDFTAAKYAEGKLMSPPRMTVRHNGIVIHNNVELPNDNPTRAAPNKAGAEPSYLYFQDHGNPVRFRNVWVVETK